jgi:hypothetical protein
LELKGRNALLVTSQKEDPHEPHAKRDPSSVKDGPCSDRALTPARSALFEPSVCRKMTASYTTARAHEPARPTGTTQVRPAMDRQKTFKLGFGEYPASLSYPLEVDGGWTAT